jgi:hypothetical protein
MIHLQQCQVGDVELIEEEVAEEKVTERELIENERTEEEDIKYYLKSLNLPAFQ